MIDQYIKKLNIKNFNIKNLNFNINFKKFNFKKFNFNIERLNLENLNIERFQVSFNARVFTIFRGVLALYCFILGAYYWVRLIGVFNQPLWRLDLMPWNWQILCCTLAVLYPIAVCGIWMGSNWGVLLWLLSGLTEIICYIFYAKSFELHLLVPFLHIFFTIVYGVFLFAKFKEDRKQKETIAEY